MCSELCLSRKYLFSVFIIKCIYYILIYELFVMIVWLCSMLKTFNGVLFCCMLNVYLRFYTLLWLYNFHQCKMTFFCRLPNLANTWYKPFFIEHIWQMYFQWNNIHNMLLMMLRLTCKLTDSILVTGFCIDVLS